MKQNHLSKYPLCTFLKRMEYIIRSKAPPNQVASPCFEKGFNGTVKKGTNFQCNCGVGSEEQVFTSADPDAPCCQNRFT
jgi:hypothetical protein